MNRALLTLQWLNVKAVARRSLRGMKSWRGAFLLLFSLGLIALMVMPQLITVVTMRGRSELDPVRSMFEPLAPLYLLGFTLLFVFTSAGEVAVAFTPAEIDLLFSAPFGRRELLVYKLAKTVLALLFVAAMMSVMMLLVLRWWLAGFVGMILALGMVQLVGMTVTMAGQIVAESVFTRTRKIILLVLVVAAIGGLSHAAGSIQTEGVAGIVATVRSSPIVRVLLAPFEVFTRTIFADRWFPDFIGWGLAALALDGVLLALLVRLDANYLEMAATVSQKVYDRIRRTKQGGGIAMPIGKQSGRMRLSDFPWLAGAGPVAWRQMLIVLRTSRHLLVMSVLIVGMLSAGLIVSPTPPGFPRDTVVPWFGIGMTFYLTFIFSMQLPWAFRGDLDQIEMLKTLPLAPTFVTIGELSGGIMALTVLQVALFGVLVAATSLGWPMFVSTVAFCLPVNATIISLNNLIFLLYPVRHPSGSTVDFQMFGKLMLFYFLQFLLLVPLFGIPAAFGLLAYWLAGYSWLACGLTAWGLLAAELVPLTLSVAMAFDRFDVSTQTPS